MTRSTPRPFGSRILRRLAPWMVLVLCLSLTGCTNKSLLGSSYAEDDFSTMPRSMRRADSHDLPTACSNKARQIERNLGYE